VEWRIRKDTDPTILRKHVVDRLRSLDVLSKNIEAIDVYHTSIFFLIFYIYQKTKLPLSQHKYNKKKNKVKIQNSLWLVAHQLFFVFLRALPTFHHTIKKKMMKITLDAGSLLFFLLKDN
jgi:hypothetical protein